MSDNILTELWQQQGDLFALVPRVVSLPATTWTLLAGPDPSRFTLTVCRSNMDDDVKVSPLPYGTSGLFASLEMVLPTQIHSAVWPLLIGGSWWGYSPAGQDVTVIDVIRRN